MSEEFRVPIRAILVLQAGIAIWTCVFHHEVEFVVQRGLIHSWPVLARLVIEGLLLGYLLAICLSKKRKLNASTFWITALLGIRFQAFLPVRSFWPLMFASVVLLAASLVGLVCQRNLRVKSAFATALVVPYWLTAVESLLLAGPRYLLFQYWVPLFPWILYLYYFILVGLALRQGALKSESIRPKIVAFSIAVHSCLWFLSPIKTV